MNYKTIMIRLKHELLSESYYQYCRASWEWVDLRTYDAVIPETLEQQNGKLTFGRRNNRELSDTEKAAFYSQYNLWKKCAHENMPILVLEHDAFCVNPTAIGFNPNLGVQYFGQHSMEAVMYHPAFAKLLCDYCEDPDKIVTGPMKLVDSLLGLFNLGAQSRYGWPHARYQGKMAPVKTILDPERGTSIRHNDGRTTVDRIKRGDEDLFKIVNLKRAEHEAKQRIEYEKALERKKAEG